MNIESLTVINRGSQRFPWAMRAAWNPLADQWEATVKPGLCNGADVTILGPEGEDVRLGDRPPLPLTAWRGIGPDAAPTGYTATESGVVLIFEPVPLFFSVRGVGPPPTVEIKLEDLGLVTQNSARANTRLLRAMDIVLYHDRLSTQSKFTISDGSDGIIVQYDTTLSLSPSARAEAYLRTVSKYEPPADQDALARLIGDWADTPRDDKWIATVYALSQPGAAAQSVPDASWQIFVQRHVYWNLHYSHNNLDVVARPNQLILHTGLAAGVGDRINDYLLGQTNDATSVLTQFLNRNTVQGSFRMA